MSSDFIKRIIIVVLLLIDIDLYYSLKGLLVDHTVRILVGFMLYHCNLVDELKPGLKRTITGESIMYINIKPLMLIPSIIFTLFSGLSSISNADSYSHLSINPKIYYGEDSSHWLHIEIPVRPHTIYKIKLFDKIVSYRNDKKAHIDFTLPDVITRNVKDIEMILEAYNDDNQYLRAIWFEVDGVGGYIGVTQIEAGQYRGNVTLGPKQKNQWEFDLSKVNVSNKNREKLVNFSEILKKPGLHTISCWISTYKQYGPQSWVSLELIFK